MNTRSPRHEPFLPIRRQQSRPLDKLVDVVCQGKSNHNCIESVDDGPRPLARSAMGLLARDPFVGLDLPILGECGVEFLAQLARRIV
jgi:hypothetical protein